MDLGEEKKPPKLKEPHLKVGVHEVMEQEYFFLLLQLQNHRLFARSLRFNSDKLMNIYAVESVGVLGCVRTGGREITT